jgi:hypothetical protein
MIKIRRIRLLSCTKISSLRVTALVVFWVALIGVGEVLVFRYESAPGRGAAAPAAWPQTTLRGPEGRSRLLVFGHPRCPCTRATLDELRGLLSRDGDRVRATIAFVKPTGADADWDDTSIRGLAASIPDLDVISDDDGALARRFGARVSGQVLLYDPAGALRFSGGITAARGHDGDNLGLERVISIVETGRADRADAPVFGCELFDD